MRIILEGDCPCDLIPKSSGEDSESLHPMGWFLLCLVSTPYPKVEDLSRTRFPQKDTTCCHPPPPTPTKKRTSTALSRLRIQHCHCCGSGYSCGVGLIPGPGTSVCCGRGQQKRGYIRHIMNCFSLPLSLPHFLSL